MPLLLKEKQELIEEIKSNIENNEIVLVASVEKMTVSDITDLRRKLREGSVTLKMYKNTLIRHAMLQMDPDNEAFQKIFEHLKGPSALVFNKETPLLACKLVSEKAKEDKRVGVKAAFFEGRYVDMNGVTGLASIGSKEMLLSRLLSVLNAPMSRLVNALKSPQSNLVHTLKAVAEKQGGGQ